MGKLGCTQLGILRSKIIRSEWLERSNQKRYIEKLNNLIPQRNELLRNMLEIYVSSPSPIRFIDEDPSNWKINIRRSNMDVDRSHIGKIDEINPFHIETIYKQRLSFLDCTFCAGYPEKKELGFVFLVPSIIGYGPSHYVCEKQECLESAISYQHMKLENVKRISEVLEDKFLRLISKDMRMEERPKEEVIEEIEKRNDQNMKRIFPELSSEE